MAKEEFIELFTGMRNAASGINVLEGVSLGDLMLDDFLRLAHLLYFNTGAVIVEVDEIADILGLAKDERLMRRFATYDLPVSLDSFVEIPASLPIFINIDNNNNNNNFSEVILRLIEEWIDLLTGINFARDFSADSDDNVAQMNMFIIGLLVFLYRQYCYDNLINPGVDNDRIESHREVMKSNEEVVTIMLSDPGIFEAMNGKREALINLYEDLY